MSEKQLKKIFAKLDEFHQRIGVLEEKSLGQVIFKGDGIELTAREIPKESVQITPLREYQKWSYSEDRILETRLKKMIKQAAESHGRSVGAIKSRIAKKELIYPYKP